MKRIIWEYFGKKVTQQPNRQQQEHQMFSPGGNNSSWLSRNHSTVGITNQTSSITSSGDKTCGIVSSRDQKARGIAAGTPPRAAPFTVYEEA